MKKNAIYERIIAIQDQVIAALRALHIPPYPVHYKKYFDDIFLQQADAALRKAKEEDEKKDEKETELTKYLDIAQRSISAFAESHGGISHIASLQEQYINRYTQSGVERCMNFISGLSELSQKMTEELHSAQSRIDQLSGELQKALSELKTDPLTQITNRKGLVEDLETIIRAGESKQLPVVIMMIDSDNFKTINDEYGHIAGDKVLYFLAQSMKSMIRSGDRVYRYGGEEFVIVLNRCEKEQAFAIADKIRSKIEHSHLIYSGKTIHVTVSIGATIHHAGDHYDSLMTRADEALYRAKHEGKNRAIIHY